MRWSVLLVIVLAGCIGLPKQPETSDADQALSRAADCLDRDDPAGAIRHLQDHLEAHADQPAIRTLLAGQYAALGQWTDAAREYDAAIEELNDDPDDHRDQLIQCHTKRVTVAAEMADDRAEAKHRGIALLMIATKLDSPDRALLIQALEQLKIACDADRGDAVAHVYLGDCLMKLNQPSAARAAFAVARNAPPGSLPESLRRMIP